jgi:hypothetical protein
MNQAGEKYLEHCMLVLEEIAFSIHKNTNDSISYEQIVGLISDLNQQRDLTINIDKCLTIVKSANIIKMSQSDNLCEFSDRNYLAYFIARKLNKLIEKKGFNIPELEYVYKYICYGINDNILLFLSFLRDNTNFALGLCDKLSEILSHFDELDFDKNNISFLKRNYDDNSKIPNNESKENFEKTSESAERKFREEENHEIQFRRIYDYDENIVENFPNNIVRAIKYLEIISKSLISHFVNLESEEKQKIVELMYSAPNRILYALFFGFEQKYDETVAELKSLVDSFEEIEGSISIQNIEKIINQVAIGLCLGLFDNVAFFGVNNDTLRRLDSFDLKNSNYKIQNLIMAENGATTGDFTERAIRLNENENNPFSTSLIRLVIRKHLLTHDVDYKIIDRITSTVFPSSSKTQLLISAQSGKQKKE